MMRQRKRITSAWLLWSVFVSMILLTGLHHHEPTANLAADCVECAHHIHHSGHFTAATEHVNDCVLCQFLSLVYTPAATLMVVSSNVNCLCCEVGQYDSTRAPPFIL